MKMIEKGKNMNEKTSKKRLYHLVFNSTCGTCCYNLFVENDLIIEIELNILYEFSYNPELCRIVSDRALLPCSLEKFKRWLIAFLNECKDPSLIDYNIHSTNRAMLRKVIEKQPKQPNRKEKRRNHRLKKMNEKEN